MRWIILLFTCIIILLVVSNTASVIALENKVYEIYVNDFNSYLIINEQYEAVIDEEKLNRELEKYGEVNFYKGDYLHFSVKGKCFHNYYREYWFYLEKKYETE